MKNKKRIEISRFDNFFDKKQGVRTKKVYNFMPTDKLKNSKGVELAKFPYSFEDQREYPLDYGSFQISSINGVGYFQQYFDYSSIMSYRLIVYDNNKKVYINYLLDEDPSIVYPYNLTFNSKPTALAFKQNDTDVIIISDGEKMVIWKTMNTPYQMQNTPIITSMCTSGNVLFCTLKDPAYKIWYTTDLDAENVGDIGRNSNYISLEDGLGDAKKVIVYDRNVYVIREYGISKINLIKNDIVVTEVYKSNTRILHNTVGVCGNLLWFMTKHGLFTFNGIKVSKSSVDISSMLSGFNENATAASLGNDFYLALRLDFNDDKEILCEENENYINNALLIVNSTDYSYQIVRGVDIGTLLPVKTPIFEKMVCTFNTENNLYLGQICDSSKVFSNNLPKYWLSENLTEGLEPKVLTNLTVDADANVVFKLIYGNKQQSFTTYKSGYNSFNFKIYCNDVKLEISSSNESAKVEKVYIDYYEQ